MNSKFITFEGGEGSGKTTQSKRLFQHLLSKGEKAIWTREIGGTDFAEKVRDLVVNNEILPKTELLMVMAARSEHIEKIIKPALDEGKYVICDRFVDSTASYQGSFIEEINTIFELHEALFNGFLPSQTFYMKIDPEVALKRAIARGDINKYEEKHVNFHKKIASNYALLSEMFKDRIVTIDASLSEDEIFERVVHYCLSL